MESDGIAQSEISAFESTFNSLTLGSTGTGIIPESTITPVSELVHIDNISAISDNILVASAVFLKLNGGLGTEMGLDRAKSLLEVRSEERDHLNGFDSQASFLHERAIWSPR